MLVTSSTNRHLQRVAENLLWKLEKEETAITKSHGISTMLNVTLEKYDIMLSYSHSDKDLCYHIHDCLVKDNFRVWIDRDQMHGQTMVAMATAIENSDFVFLCMSEAYKQSAYCQSEAHYAFERQCYLVPLIMKSGYRPDGWLGIIASGKIYIDFPKLGFNVAYEKNYPHCINQWTTTHVRSFLINEKLDSLLPVLGNMNGRLLHETYKRCKAHWDLMFQTFKAEVAADDQQKLLTIDTYIRFLDAIEKYIPIVSNDTSKPSTSTSMFCTVV
ncbi:unnamed protein product [Rotaria sp. Silwood1]|nr:unnamed protein product [Rotaria sp. Silwood1]CAF1057199.1 unnamed protein product [Rotaria sp. Silwood1]CAF1102085.1 unnamed protein product [Rotaria sp. Silwood1]CAF3405438.1 unnamed protein product [Rotaria sp. Silwood1]CAF3425471.1 unnamed protein product [Rotaria sp. Silwood1]